MAIEPVTAILMPAGQTAWDGLGSSDGEVSDRSTATRQPTNAGRQAANRRSTGSDRARNGPRPAAVTGRGSRAADAADDSVERVAAGAGALRVGVVDGEALRVDPVDEVDRGAGQVRHAHPVDHDLDPAELA